MLRIDKNTTREQLAAIVCGALRTETTEPVLVGGSVVAVYSGELFPSDDLDFSNWRPLREVERALAPLGFKFKLNVAQHDACPYYIQFVSAPPMVGEKHVKSPLRRKTTRGSFLILAPLDCVLDRLAAYLAWHDAQTLEQAAYVAAKRRVDLRQVERWVEREKGDAAENLRRFGQFKQRVAELRKRTR